MPSNRNAVRILMIAVAAGTTLFVILALLRLTSAVSFTEPLQMQTSGAEFESLFAVWKYVHGLAVYNDRYQPPYNAVVYNWLFYESYGFFTKSVMAALDLRDAWLPTSARFLTLFAVVTVAVGAYLAFVRVTAASGPARIVLAGFALLIAAGPLMGFWIFTVRPDIWALAFEVLAGAWFVHRYPNSRWAAIAGAALFAYLAWSFKQSSVTFLLSVGLFLLIRMAWRELAAMILVMASAFALTFVVGEPQYVKNILFSGYPLEFALERAIANIKSFTIKMAPGILLMAAALAFRFRAADGWAEVWRNDTKLFCSVAALVSAGLAMATSFQVGGAENYFFAFAFYLTLGGLALMPSLDRWQKPELVLSGAGWLLIAGAVLMVLSGRIGMTGLRHNHDANMAIKSCIETLPRPLYVEHPYVSLPWMSDGDEYFILSYVYGKERQAARAFGNGGIGGYIERGDLKALVLVGEAAPAAFDGTPLDGYEQRDTACSGYAVMVKKDGD